MSQLSVPQAVVRNPFQMTDAELYAQGSHPSQPNMDVEEVKSGPSASPLPPHPSGSTFWVDCPHCHEPFELAQQELNCCIFRHGWFVENGNPMPPHASKEQCDYWVSSGKLLGCGKPFRYNKQTNTTEVCDYI